MEPESTPEEKDPKLFKNVKLDKVKPETEFKSVENNSTADSTESVEGTFPSPKEQIKQIVKAEE